MKCPALSVYILRHHVCAESFEDSLAQGVFCVWHIFHGTYLIRIYPDGIFIACTCRDCYERHCTAFLKLADGRFGNTKSHMAFVEVRAIMIFPKDDTVGLYVFLYIPAYNKFLICHPFEFDPVLSTFTGVIQAGGSFGYDSLQLLLIGCVEQADAVRGDEAGDGDKAVLADGGLQGLPGLCFCLLKIWSNGTPGNGSLYSVIPRRLFIPK